MDPLTFGLVALALHAMSRPTLRLPVTGLGTDWVITSPFGSRVDPIDETPADHRGVDLAPRPRGTRRAVRAPVAGRVVASGWVSSGGQRIKLVDDQGNVHGFYHLAELVAELGERLNAGAVLGWVAPTTTPDDRTTAAHLHWQIKNVDGVFIDPLNWAALPALVG